MKAEDFLTERDKIVFTQAGFGKKLKLGTRPMFIVVDTTYEFVGPKREPILDAIKKIYTACGLEGYAAVDSIQRMLPFVRANNIPVAYTVMDRTMETPFDKKDLKAEGNYVHHSEWEAIVKEIEPLPGDTIIAKLAPSAYFGTKLLQVQLAKKIDTVIIVGGTTSGCVRASAIDAFSYGFNVAIVESGVFDRGQASHSMTLFDVGAKYGDVLSEKQAIEYFTSTEIDFHD